MFLGRNKHFEYLVSRLCTVATDVALCAIKNYT